MPFASFGGITGAVNISLRNDFPLRSWAYRIPIGGSIIKVAGAHTVQSRVLAGERAAQSPRQCDCLPAISTLAATPTTPSTAIGRIPTRVLGNFRSYTESASRPNIDLRGQVIDWYVQDTWKATRRLTVDYGMRFTYSAPYKQANDIGANFLPSAFSQRKKVVLYRPVLDSTGKRVAQNPLTGELAAVSYIGAVVPNSGNIRNGMVFAGASGVPDGFIENRGVHFAPRFGFAYDRLRRRQDGLPRRFRYVLSVTGEDEHR